MSATIELFEDNVESYNNALLIMNNIKEGGKISIKRFSFTPIEESILNFVEEVLKANLKILNEELEKTE